MEKEVVEVTLAFIRELEEILKLRQLAVSHSQYIDLSRLDQLEDEARECLNNIIREYAEINN